MAEELNRRTLLKMSSLAAIGSLSQSALGAPEATSRTNPIRLNLNENAFGPSAGVAPAIQREMSRIARYGEVKAAQAFAEPSAAYERVPVEQIVLGEILADLGLFLGSQGGAGGEFIYSTPGYTALIDAAARVGGVGVAVPLNAAVENDLEAIAARVNPKTRAVYLINPHNPTGTVNDAELFIRFLREISRHALVIVDEAYLEYTGDFHGRSAVSLVREGANVAVFRTFDKIHGLAGLPMGYTIAPKSLAGTLRDQGLGDAESLGRLNMAAASAALSDTSHTRKVQTIVTEERAKWTAVLNDLGFVHTDSKTNFIFFQSGLAQPDLSRRMLEQGVQIGRLFAPYDQWARITIGTPRENLIAQGALRTIRHSAVSLNPWKQY